MAVHPMEHQTAFVCPACGFRVFNRRYPKCESCHSSLPASVVYTSDERKQLFAAESTQAQWLSRPDATGSGLGGAAAEFGLLAVAHLAAAVATGNS
jgi:DNA-directed RNA polymerase subunit RPC12/RpoP